MKKKLFIYLLFSCTRGNSFEITMSEDPPPPPRSHIYLLVISIIYPHIKQILEKSPSLPPIIPPIIISGYTDKIDQYF